MGAFGAALTARMHYQDEADHLDVVVKADGSEEQSEAEPALKSEPKAAAFKKTEPAKPEVHVVVVDGVTHTASSILTGDALDNMSMTTERDVCKLCQNHCKLTITTFSDGSRFVTGNRCERGGDAKKKRSDRPNLYDYKYKRCFAYRRLTDKKATRGEIGVPRALNMYENYPFWFTLLTSLGFKVMISGRSSHELFETGIESIASENICYPAKLVHGHIKWLINKGIKTIFYPCVSYEENLVPNTDNHYNCPVVANYPLVVGANMPELREDDVRYMHPYFNLANHELMVDRIVEEFAWANVTREEAETAVKAAYAEDKVFKHDVQQEGLTALAYMKEHNCRGIVLAGRPYHIDPEINHGIPETICSLGMVVLSEDSICELQPGEKLNLTEFLSEGEADPRSKNAAGFRHVGDRTVTKMPLRVTNQWAYHSRLYAAAHFVASYPGLELVQLNSFGCGLDAIVADQVQDILAHGHKIHTLLKIDEGSNLGAIRIRLRSLLFVMNHRPKEDYTLEPYSYEKTIFTKEDAKKNVILAPSMTPIHFPMLMSAFEHEGYHVELLPHQNQEAIDTGLAYIHNDACYPAIMSLGQILTALKSGKYDLNHTTVMISQTGGCCRATNYIGMIRKALNDANMSQVAILSLNMKGMNKQPGFQPGLGFWHRLIMGMIYGDALQQVLYRTRPYEKVKGTAEALFNKWQKKCTEQLHKADFTSFKRNLRDLIHEFDNIEMSEEKKPRIGLVGEIYVKFHPIANNHIVRMIEEEGGEIIVSGLADFFLYGLLDDQFRHKYLSGSWKDALFSKTGVRLLEWYRKPYEQAVAKSRHFDPITSIYDIADEAKKFLSLGHEAGEGWFLTGDMIDLIHRGAKNIVCLQPWACLPNHVTGKGMIKTLKAAFPETNIVAIDYDPSASSVNQTNRLKLMLTTTFEGIRETVQEDTKPVMPFMSGVRINSSLRKITLQHHKERLSMIPSWKALFFVFQDIQD